MDEDVVAIARRWIGTPYFHQASLAGVGTDCLGLIRGIWRERYGDEPEALIAYTADWGECGGQELLLSAALRHLVLVQDRPLAAGQVLLFRMRQGAIAKHLGIVSKAEAAAPAFIHAYSRHGVVESPLTAAWRLRITARFRFP